MAEYPETSANVAGRPSRSTDPLPSPQRILVLDDDRHIRRIMRRRLRESGCDVTTVANGREGLQALLRDDYDVAVVDLRMQEMDGMAFVQEALKIWPWLQIIICSGYLDEDVIRQAEALGVSHVLSKPVEYDSFAALVRRLAETSKSEGARGRHPPERLQQQLRLLRQITESGLHERNLPAALNRLGDGLTQLLPADLLGILVTENSDCTLFLRPHRIPEPHHISDIKSHMSNRYQALSGEPLPLHYMQLDIKPARVEEESDIEQFGTIVSVPIISDDQVHGLITLCSGEADAYSPSDIAFLYQTSNQLSTILVALGEIRSMAIRDSLTGLYNRRHLDEQLERMWLLSRRYHHPMAVLAVDLDHFKDINDSLGHAVGDEVIKEFADLLKTETRASDILARHGGDEFLIVLSQANVEEAEGLATRMLEKVREHPFLSQDHSLALTASIGVALYRPERGALSHEDLVHQADQALYLAKQEGRNRMAVYRTEHDAPVEEEPVESPETDPPPERSRSSVKARVLVVDDEASVIRILHRMLVREGYDILSAQSVEEAIPLLQEHRGHIDILLTDLALPTSDGFEMLRQAQERDPRMVRIVISGYVTADNAISALRHGAYDFVQKPFVREQLLAQLDRALEYRTLLRENDLYRNHLEDMIRAKSAEVTTALNQIKTSYEFTLETMVAMLDAREYETSRHSLRVRELTEVLARHMGIEPPELDDIARGALLHDIGKIGIPDAILQKPGQLTPEEWDTMKRHPEIGYRFLKSSPFLKDSAEIVLSHHEKYSGGGYPRGLKGTDICLGARIFSVIDAYDAIRSPRVYKPSLPREQAEQEIRSQSGKQFDPDVVDAFLSIIPEIERRGQWSDSGLQT